MKQSSITVAKGEKWATLSLSLGEDLGVGKCAYIKGAFVVEVKHTSDVCEAYDSEEWEIAILSGAPYAFRLMSSSHKEIIVQHLKGFLDQDDLEGVSIASAIAIVDILGGDIQEIVTGEWRLITS